jgi:hypothetical protein
MAQPGKIAVTGTGNRQLILSAAVVRWYRITNTSSNVMGVTFTNDSNESGRSAQLAPNTSKDFMASKLEIRDDTGAGVVGNYEALP